MTSQNFTRVALLDELTPNKGYKVWLNQKEIALFLIGDIVYAIGNLCPHQGGELADGYVQDYKVHCPLHHWSFDLRNGAYTFNPTMKIETFITKISDGAIFIAPTSD